MRSRSPRSRKWLADRARASRRRHRARSPPGSRRRRSRRAGRHAAPTWATDSSPVIRRARRSREIAPSAVRSNVDLPTPGSPPTSTSDAGTSPPPSTRSSSGTPVGMRSASSATTSTSRSGTRGAVRAGGPPAGDEQQVPPPRACRIHRSLGNGLSQRPDDVPHSLQDVQDRCRLRAHQNEDGTPTPRRHLCRFGTSPDAATDTGDSDLQVSEISLGSWLTYGGGVATTQARACIDAAFDAGINFIDTSNVYGLGAAEAFLGRCWRRGRATRTCWRRSSTSRWTTPARTRACPGAGPKQIDASLARLRTDYVDLYQCHRYDPETPLEETMEALTEVVQAGKARYIGFSEWTAEQIQASLDRAQSTAREVRLVAAAVLAALARAGARGDSRSARRTDLADRLVAAPQGALTGKYRPGEAPPAGLTGDERPDGPAMGRWLATRSSRACSASSRSPSGSGSRWRSSRSPGCCASDECRLGDRRRLAARAGARQRRGLGDRARRRDAGRDRRRPEPLGSARGAQQAPLASRGRRAEPRAPEERACGARAPAGETTRRWSTRSGAARRSGRSSGRCSWRSCPATTSRSPPTRSRRRRYERRGLRDVDEIDLERESARLWHWRARTTRRPGRRAVELPERFATFDQLVAATAMRGFEQGLLPTPMRGDFRAYGKVYRHLGPSSTPRRTRSRPSATTRSLALRRGRVWDDVPLDT